MTGGQIAGGLLIGMVGVWFMLVGGILIGEHREWGNRYLGECTCTCCTMEEIEMEGMERKERLDAEEIASREHKKVEGDNQ